jgi:hypothetical protein
LTAGQRGFDAVGGEVERRTTVHDQGIALVVGEHEHGGVERGLWPPPAFPVTTPLAADRAEHAAAHDERLGVAERVLLGLVVAGREAVR